MIKSIDVYKLEKLLGSINLIDVRSVEKYNTSHIDTSINIPAILLQGNPSKYLNKIDTYYIYCMHGYTSFKVCNLLYRLGYNVINVTGGYEAWLLK